MMVTDRDDSARLAQLEKRINALKEGDAPEKSHHEEHYSQAQAGWRMVIELVAGLLIGFGMGYGLDLLLGTLPIFLVLFTLLGLAAGIKTMMRTAQELTGPFDDGKAAGRTGAVADNEVKDGD